MRYICDIREFRGGSTTLNPTPQLGDQGNVITIRQHYTQRVPPTDRSVSGDPAPIPERGVQPAQGNSRPGPGRDVAADLGGGVRGVELQPEDPLCEEWVIVTIGAHTASALVARELDDPSRRDGDRRFEFLITSDRALVTAAARSMLARVP